MRLLAAAFAGVVTVSPAVAGEREEPFASRTTPPKRPIEHTQQRAGNPQRVAWWAVPGVGPHDAGGVVGGGSLFKGRSPGPADGVVGWDYALGRRKRVFLGFGGPAKGEFYPKYEADGRRLPDPVAAAPFRKAVREARAEH